MGGMSNRLVNETAYAAIRSIASLIEDEARYIKAERASEREYRRAQSETRDAQTAIDVLCRSLDELAPTANFQGNHIRICLVLMLMGAAFWFGAKHKW